MLAWNQWAMTQACLESLFATDLAGAEVLVVDNGSTDETPDRLREMDGLRSIHLPKNVGFVRGNNAGLAEIPEDHDVVLLNNDLLFTQADWLTRLRECAHDSPSHGIVGCRLRLPDGPLLHAGTYIVPDTMWGQQIGSLEEDIGQYPRDRTVEGIVFAVAYIKREVIDAVGDLSLDFESYFEDTDYCLRAQQEGYEVVVCGGVTLDHDEHGSTRDNEGALMKIFQKSRKIFARKWKKHLEARYHTELAWQSILNFPTGYAMSSREYLKALDRQGVRVSYSYVYGPGTVYPPEEPQDAKDYRLNIFSKRKSSRPDISVVYGQGDAFERSRGRYKIGFTMLEVDGFPKEWVRQAEALDEVWVPSEFNRQGLLNSGLTRPIHKIPLGVDTNYFNRQVERHPSPYGEFTFLSAFEWGERKEPWLLLKIFNDEFGADEPVRLVCKIINRDPRVSLKHEISALRLGTGGGRVSYILNREFPHYQLGSLYRSADCFVAVSRGEGWNMPLMEAMACGLPSIATDWGAHPEFFHSGVGYPLAIRGTVRAVARCPYYTGYSWADPDPDHLRHQLRHVYENRQEARAKGDAAADEVEEQWTWDHAAQRIVDRLRQIQG